MPRQRLKRNYCTLFDERFLALYDHQLTVDIKGIARLRPAGSGNTSYISCTASTS
ncbi:MAG: hypothetical protein MZV70_53425 [Desulfobacterales bacterium]|nr:hypothetical protein [Desulfobacterales bacterium]